jgi:predicted transcriptional regulator
MQNKQLVNFMYWKSAHDIILVLDGEMREQEIFEKSGLSHKTVREWISYMIKQKIIVRKIIFIKKNAKNMFLLSEKGLKLKDYFLFIDQLL